MKYRKIFIGATTIIGAGAIGSAVAVPIATSEQQLSSADTPNTPVNPPVDPTPPTDPSTPTDPVEPIPPTDPSTPTDPVDPTPPTDPSTPTDPVDPTPPTDPSTPTDPVEPDKPTLTASIPSSSSDTFHFTLPSSSPINDSNALNAAINLLFTNNSNFAQDYSPSGDQVSYLEGSANYHNVTLTYVPNSAVFSTDRSSFKMLATPVDGSAWTDGTTEAKTLNIVTEITYLAEVPEANKDSFTYPIKITNQGSENNDDLLNTTLTNLFSNSSQDLLSGFRTYFANGSSYHNVKLIYVANSANLEAKTFKVQATPIINTKWSDRTTTTKTIDVTLSTLNFTQITNDASISSSTAIFSDMLSGVTSTDDLVNYFKTNFSLDKLKDFKATNVDYYVDYSSISWDTSSFKVYVVPKANHTWSDGSFTTRFIDVSYACDAKCSYAPTIWSLDSVIYCKSDLTFWSEVKNGTADFNSIASTAVYDMSMYSYKNIQYVDGSVSIPKSLAINKGYVAVFNIQVVPTEGFTWADGTTTAKDVTINLYTSDYIQVGPVTAEQGLKYTLGDASYQRWVSNFTFSTGNFGSGTFADNQAILKAQALSDLENTFSRSGYTISISDPTPFSVFRYDYYDTWTYKITFTSKTTGQTVTTTGYTFTASPSTYVQLYG